MRFRNTLLLACMLTTSSLMFPAIAQETDAPQEDENKQQIKVLPPAYDEQMMRLSEILGSLHYLRELCGANEGQLWRRKMQELIETEEPTPERRAEMTSRFNRGFRAFRETYRDCTDAALEANNRYIFEGTKLSSEIPTRYGR